MTLTVIVVLALGGLASYAAYKDEKKGAAILVGVAVVGLLYLILGPVPSGDVQQIPSMPPSAAPSSPAPAIGPSDQ